MGKMINKRLREDLGQQLLSLRKKQKLSIPEIANDCDVSANSIMAIESGCSNVSFKKYNALARYYGKVIKLVLVDYDCIHDAVQK